MSPLRVFVALASIAVCTTVLVAQPPMPAPAPLATSPGIRLIVPEQDTSIAFWPLYRLSASATPGCSVTLNGTAQKVYPSGAFAGALQLAVGENRYTLVATDPSGRTATKEFLVIRRPPPQSTPPDSLTIDPVMMEPHADLWLAAGDLLEVQCKGTPGCRVSCLEGIPLHEVAPADAGGLRGVYRGSYRVGPGDRVTERPLFFRLEDSAGNAFVRDAGVKVSMRGSDLPLVGVTRGMRTVLYCGLGDDRLGGANMQRLTQGVRLAITGRSGDLYRVRLSEGQEAWVDTGTVQLQPAGTFLPYSLTGNWNVYGDSLYDYVTVTLNDRLPYIGSQEMSPNRIVVDLYGAVSNSNWIIQQATVREITNVTYRQAGRQVFRIMIDLKHKQPWGYSISYNGNTLVVQVRRQPEKLKIKALRFAIDAGHGGDQNGALGSTGAKEKDVNLSTVLHLKELLEDRGATVVLTRGDDTAVPMGARLNTALSSRADILVSVHSNSIGLTSNPEDTRGVSTYYKHIGYRPLSQFILKRVMETGMPAYGNVGSFNFSLVAPTELPDVLVELAYMSNPLDEMKLLDDGYRKELARAIVRGIDDFLDWCDE
ncbi:MAG TPA: N-acetylmuramoyl-L-alanine amidase [Bacteroidota bacterium]